LGKCVKVDIFNMPAEQADERTQLLKDDQLNSGRNQHRGGNQQNGNASQDEEEGDDDDDAQVVEFEQNDKENPRHWPHRWKYLQVFLVTIIGLLLPMASSIFAPGISEIAADYDVNS